MAQRKSKMEEARKHYEDITREEYLEYVAALKDWIEKHGDRELHPNHPWRKNPPFRREGEQ